MGRLSAPTVRAQMPTCNPAGSAHLLSASRRTNRCGSFGNPAREVRLHPVMLNDWRLGNLVSSCRGGGSRAGNSFFFPLMRKGPFGRRTVLLNTEGNVKTATARGVAGRQWTRDHLLRSKRYPPGIRVQLQCLKTHIPRAMHLRATIHTKHIKLNAYLEHCRARAHARQKGGTSGAEVP